MARQLPWLQYYRLGAVLSYVILLAMNFNPWLSMKRGNQDVKNAVAADPQVKDHKPCVADIQGIQQKIADLRARLEGHDDEIKAAKSTKFDMAAKNDMPQLKGEVSRLKSDVDKLKNGLHSITTKAPSLLNPDNKQLADELDKLKNEVARLLRDSVPAVVNSTDGISAVDIKKVKDEFQEAQKQMETKLEEISTSEIKRFQDAGALKDQIWEKFNSCKELLEDDKFQQWREIRRRHEHNRAELASVLSGADLPAIFNKDTDHKPFVSTKSTDRVKNVEETSKDISSSVPKPSLPSSAPAHTQKPITVSTNSGSQQAPGQRPAPVEEAMRLLGANVSQVSRWAVPLEDPSRPIPKNAASSNSNNAQSQPKQELQMRGPFQRLSKDQHLKQDTQVEPQKKTKEDHLHSNNQESKLRDPVPENTANPVQPNQLVNPRFQTTTPKPSEQEVEQSHSTGAPVHLPAFLIKLPSSSASHCSSLGSSSSLDGGVSLNVLA
ncbi:hypothetical protein UCRPC4_g06268 [Phaeomoniella chlamydospora]|uniref:Uncharacterized protein n=1 Tax=Phaeomoniella chlamydospora TaxID=158046 RepID=A0A0G2DZJ3_PHACM|nr:hypothetical protein UCRPC4_g06268 [Phaeomoniella chlamydospora]